MGMFGLMRTARRFVLAGTTIYALACVTHVVGTPKPERLDGLMPGQLPGRHAVGSEAAAGGRRDGAQAAVVDRVIDGDTLMATPLSAGSLPKNKSVTVRLLEIDTPETVKPGSPVMCGGPTASAFTKHLLPTGTPIVIVPDREKTDRYGRALRYVYLADGRMVEKMIAAAGYARPLLIEPNDAHIAEIRSVATGARHAGRGMWGQCRDPYAPAS